MNLAIATNWVQKLGASEAEYEDAHAFRFLAESTGDDGSMQYSAAIADGATDSWHSGLWARILATGAVKGDSTATQMSDRFEELRQRWRHEAVPADASWVSEEKARGGAHAAILVLSVRTPSIRGEPGTWSAWAVGDCCLFQLREGNCITSFPYARAEEFACNPKLVETGSPVDQFKSIDIELSGRWQTGDEFLMATDALALWCMERIDESGKYDEAAFAEVTRPQSRAAFLDWVARARKTGHLRNDDTSLVAFRTG